MPGRISFCLALTILITLLLAGCNLPADPAPAGPGDALPAASGTDSPERTAAAATIVARLTEIASPATSTPAPGSVPASSEGQAGGSGPDEQPGASADEVEAAEQDATATVVMATLSLEMTQAAVTPTETPTPLPTATLAPDDPKQGLGPAAWQDTFASSENWPVYSDDHVEMDLSSGDLAFTALNADKYDGWMLSWQVVDDVYLEATAKTGEECAGLDRYGLVFRAPEPTEGLLFGVSCDGQYSLRRWNGQRTTYLVEWTPSDLINTGANATNVLGIRADGSQITLYANGKLLSEVRDSVYFRGGFGPFIGAVETPGFTVTFTDVAYWLLP